MYIAKLENQTIIMSDGASQKSIKLDVGAIQEIDLGTKDGVVLLDGDFRHVFQDRGETEWILRYESYLCTSEYVPVQSETDSLTLSSTESEQCNNV